MMGQAILLPCLQMAQELLLEPLSIMGQELSRAMLVCLSILMVDGIR